MDKLLAFVPVARATIGMDTKGTSIQRQWMFVVHAGKSPAPGAKAVVESYPALLSRIASIFLRDTEMHGGAAIAAVVGEALSAIDAAVSTPAIAGVAAAGLRGGLIEVGVIEPLGDLSHLVSSSGPGSLYEILSDMTAALAAKDADTGWADGRIFEMGPPEDPSMKAGSRLSPDASISAASALAGLASLTGLMLRMRTDPVLQVSGAALAAARIPSLVIRQIARATGRVRYTDSSAALLSAPFDLPRFDLVAVDPGFPPAYCADLAIAAISLLDVSGRSQVRAACTASLDEVLTRAEDLTALQVKAAPKDQQTQAKAAMTQALAHALALRDGIDTVVRRIQPVDATH